MTDLIDKITRHLMALPPHIKARRTAKLLEEALMELMQMPAPIVDTALAENRTPDMRGPAAVIDGCVLTGFKIIGPFQNVEAAFEWCCAKSLKSVVGIPTTIALIESPQQHERGGQNETTTTRVDGSS